MSRGPLLALFAAAALAPAAVLTAPAGADEVTTTDACVPASDPPTSDKDTTWSVRLCDVPDFDQSRAATAEFGQPTPIAVAGLPGNGACHCVLTTLADLYARAQASLKDTADFETFDWNGRGALAAPSAGGLYDTTTYTAGEVAAYEGTTKLLQGLGDIADVSYGQDKAHESCGTSFGAIYTKLPKVAEQFGDSADDYAFGESGIDDTSAADMARALAGGAGVAIAFGYYTNHKAGVDGAADTADKRAGGHANALVGVSRNGDAYTFETSDPAATAETAGADELRQSAFARTIRAGSLRSIKVGADTGKGYNLDDTDRYLESWLQFGTTRLAIRLRDKAKLRLTRLLPDLKIPPRPITEREPIDFTFPGPVLDASFDLTTQRLLALATVRGKPALYAADAVTGKVVRVATALPKGSDRLAALADGATAVLGGSVVRTIGRDGRATGSAKVAGGGADVAFDGGTGGLLVLRADGKRVLRYSRTLKVRSTRKVALPKGAGPAASTGRLSAAADGTTRLSRRPLGSATTSQTFATPSGGRIAADGGKVRLLGPGGRSIAFPSGSVLLDVSTPTVSRRPPGGARLTDSIDRPLPAATPGPTPEPLPGDDGGPDAPELP